MLCATLREHWRWAPCKLGNRWCWLIILFPLQVLAIFLQAFEMAYQVFQGWHSCTNSCVVCDFLTFVQGHIQVSTDLWLDTIHWRHRVHMIPNAESGFGGEYFKWAVRYEMKWFQLSQMVDVCLTSHQYDLSFQIAFAQITHGLLCCLNSKGWSPSLGPLWYFQWCKVPYGSAKEWGLLGAGCAHCPWYCFCHFDMWPRQISYG